MKKKVNPTKYNGRFIDLTGKQFKNLLVIKRCNYNLSNRAYWLCRCVCGKELEIQGYELRSGKKTSCGCLRINSKTGVYGKRKAKGTGQIVQAYHNMHSRCYKESDDFYYRYGGRGITVCEEWHDFDNFKLWCIDNNLTKGLTIDRINNNLGYSPENCKVSTKFEQLHNRGMYSTNTTGYRYVSKIGNKYQSSYQYNGKCYYIGLFNTPEEAYNAAINHRKERNFPVV